MFSGDSHEIHLSSDPLTCKRETLYVVRVFFIVCQHEFNLCAFCNAFFPPNSESAESYIYRAACWAHARDGHAFGTLSELSTLQCIASTATRTE